LKEYPQQLQIMPLARPPRAVIAVPGSKSLTNRALIVAALGENCCTIHNALKSDDTAVMAEALRALGRQVEVFDEGDCITVHPSPGARRIPVEQASLFVGNSGTSMRFLSAFVCLEAGSYRLDGVPRMRERPIGDLLKALDQLGVRVQCEFGNDCPPVRIESKGLSGGTVTIRGDTSSQFLSALLLVAPFVEGDTSIRLDGTLVSKPYVQMTIEFLRHCGLQLDTADLTRFDIPGWQKFSRREIAIEPDASGASYFWAAAAITGGSVTVPEITRASLQGDVRFVELLKQMGCRVEYCSSGITVHGRELHGIDADMNDISDTVMTLAVVACFANGPTTIRNVSHIRHKETDRISAVATEIRRIGADVEELSDGLKIVPGLLHGACVQTYDDHRMAMSLALAGLRVPGLVVDNPGCVAKTYPGFWEDLKLLG
jgi:3-phosphoshikimate 1-carboxyvinyltransferase